MITSITSLAVSPTTKTLNIGETVQLTGTVNPSLTTEGVQWISSNTSVAIVSDSGLVTAKASGTATITFKNSSGTKSASCIITVIFGNISLGTEYGQLIKYDENGNQQWSKQITYIDGGHFSHNAVIYSVAKSLDESTVLGTGTGLLMKYDKDGNQQWSKQITYKNGGNFSRNAVIYSVATASDGSIILGTDTGLLMKYDKDGNQQWSKQITYIDGGHFSHNDSITSISTGIGHSSGYNAELYEEDDD